MSLDDTLRYFSKKLKMPLPEEDLSEGMELLLDTTRIILSPTDHSGGIELRLPLGLLLHPIRQERLLELTRSNFLGSGTEGCTLSFDDAGVTLSLSTVTTPGTSPQENWEWLHRLLHASKGWTKTLEEWEEFIPILSTPKKKKKGES